MLNDTNKQQRWNQRYLDKVVTDPQPCWVLKANQHLFPAKAKVLDLACGLGGNAVFLARQGFDVTAMDYSAVALERLDTYAKNNGLSIKTRLTDLEDIENALGQYDLITVSYYLQRNLFPNIFSAMNQGALLFYQTFTECQDKNSGPNNSAFRLTHGELLSLCNKQRILFYREDPEDSTKDSTYKGEAMIVVKRDLND